MDVATAVHDTTVSLVVMVINITIMSPGSRCCGRVPGIARPTQCGRKERDGIMAAARIDLTWLPPQSALTREEHCNLLETRNELASGHRI